MRILAALATLVAGIALACVVAWWGWQLFGPPVVQIPARGPSNPVATLVAADLFGGSGAPSASAGATGGGATLAGDTRLLGIIAEEGQRGHALFRLPTGPKLVAKGEEISAGATLIAIEPDAVTIRDGGGERRFPLRSSARTANVSAPAPAASVPAATRTATAAVRREASAACAPPSGFRGTVVRLNAELLVGIDADTLQWRNWLSPVPGGLVVREDNGFGAMLGLKTGDRIAQANGIALGVPEDVSAAIVRPLVANQGVRLIGARDGATQELWLANVACAG